MVTFDVIKQDMLPILQILCNDSIPNIRFNVAKAYKILIDLLYQTEYGNRVLQEVIRPDLGRLQEDQDVDVRYFANLGFERLDTVGILGSA